MSTTYKPIEGFPFYEVGDEGTVRSIDRIDCKGRSLKGCVIKGSINNVGYRKVNLYIDGVQYSRDVHVLVAKAFVPNPLGLLQVNHKHEDGDKTRNNKDNLEWCTCQENIKHCADVLGKHTRGERNAQSKLKVEDIISIRKSPLSASCLAKKYKVSSKAIQNILSRKSWKHVTEKPVSNGRTAGIVTDIEAGGCGDGSAKNVNKSAAKSCAPGVTVERRTGAVYTRDSIADAASAG